MKPLGPKIRVPPLFYFAGFFIGLLLEAMVVRLRFADGDAATTITTTGWVAAIAGFVFSAWGIATFQRAGTTMFPFEPAHRLVQHGPYRFTRNPMYVGGVITYVGFAMVMNAIWPIVLLPVVIWTTFLFVIRHEERYLTDTFGEEYESYRRRVRRWL
jgi:protein-S-isoprenylcysteine O-methyltransferase Ste14